MKPRFNYEEKHRTAVIFVGAVYGWERVWKWQRDVLQRQSMCVYAVCYQIRFCLIETLWEDWGLWPLRLASTRPSSVELCQIDTVCHRLLLYLCFLTTAGNQSFLQHLRAIHFWQQLYFNNLKKKYIYNILNAVILLICLNKTLLCSDPFTQKCWTDNLTEEYQMQLY